MCACQDTFVCSKCAGDPKQDWRELVDAYSQPATDEWWLRDWEESERLASMIERAKAGKP